MSDIEKLSWQREELIRQLQQKTQENKKLKEHLQQDDGLLEESWQRIVENGYIANLGNSRSSLLSGKEIEAIHGVWVNTNIDEKDRDVATAKLLGMSEEKVKDAGDETPGFRSESGCVNKM